MEILRTRIALSHLRNNCMNHFEELVKADVDLGREVMAVDAAMHADLEEALLQDGAEQADVWGINLYPDNPRDSFIEYTSLINIRPSQDNFSMEIQDPELRDRIRAVVEGLVDCGH
jgi:hypothetical protein